MDTLPYSNRPMKKPTSFAWGFSKIIFIFFNIIILIIVVDLINVCSTMISVNFSHIKVEKEFIRNVTLEFPVMNTTSKIETDSSKGQLPSNLMSKSIQSKAKQIEPNFGTPHLPPYEYNVEPVPKKTNSFNSSDFSEEEYKSPGVKNVSLYHVKKKFSVYRRSLRNERNVELIRILDLMIFIISTVLQIVIGFLGILGLNIRCLHSTAVFIILNLIITICDVNLPVYLPEYAFPQFAILITIYFLITELKAVDCHRI